MDDPNFKRVLELLIASGETKFELAMFLSYSEDVAGEKEEKEVQKRMLINRFMCHEDEIIVCEHSEVAEILDKSFSLYLHNATKV